MAGRGFRGGYNSGGRRGFRLAHCGFREGRNFNGGRGLRLAERRFRRRRNSHRSRSLLLADRSLHRRRGPRSRRKPPLAGYTPLLTTCGSRASRRRLPAHRRRCSLLIRYSSRGHKPLSARRAPSGRCGLCLAACRFRGGYAPGDRCRLRPATRGSRANSAPLLVRRNFGRGLLLTGGSSPYTGPHGPFNCLRIILFLC